LSRNDGRRVQLLGRIRAVAGSGQRFRLGRGAARIMSLAERRRKRP
jgi:hypothetical protein